MKHVIVRSSPDRKSQVFSGWTPLGLPSWTDIDNIAVTVVLFHSDMKELAVRQMELAKEEDEKRATRFNEPIENWDYEIRSDHQIGVLLAE